MSTVGRLFISLFVCGVLSVVAAAPPVAGVARSNGDLRIDSAAVSGNGTVFEGSVIETGQARSEVALEGGDLLTLIGGSRGTIHSDRMILDAGGAEISRTDSYELHARNLRVRPMDENARVQVALDESAEVRVAAIGGDAEVRNTEGVLVARVRPGMALALRPQSSGATAAHLVGELRLSGGRFLLTDEVTNVTVELRGDNLLEAVGSRVEINGTVAAGAAADGDTQVVNVSKLTVMGGGGQSGGATGAGLTSGIGRNALIVIGGVAAGGATVGALYATDTIGGDEESLSR